MCSEGEQSIGHWSVGLIPGKLKFLETELETVCEPGNPHYKGALLAADSTPTLSTLSCHTNHTSDSSTVTFGIGGTPYFYFVPTSRNKYTSTSYRQNIWFTMIR